MIIEQIQEGIVLDHITAGRSMEIYNVLGLDKMNCTVALIQNASSQKKGKKDIIKIGTPMELDLDILGYLDPGITVNIIREGKVAQRRHLQLPQRIRGVIKCKNPRCITSCEPALVHEFRLTDPENKVYRCIYCDHKAKREL